jgi:hypothetical protein
MAVGLMESRQSSRTQRQARFQTTSTEEVNIKVKDTRIQSSGDEGVQVSNKIRADGQAADCRGTREVNQRPGRRWGGAMLQGREGSGSCERLRSLERTNDVIGKLVGEVEGGLIRNEKTD